MNVETLIDALKAHGCKPRQVSDELWLAACPSCRARGRFGLLEIQVAPEGVRMACDLDPDKGDRPWAEAQNAHRKAEVEGLEGTWR